MHVDKVNDVPVQESVNQVSRNPSTEKTESDLRHTIAQSQGSPPNVDGHQGRSGQCSKENALSSEERPSRPRVTYVHQVKDVIYDLDRIWISVSREG